MDDLYTPEVYKKLMKILEELDEPKDTDTNSDFDPGEFDSDNSDDDTEDDTYPENLDHVNPANIIYQPSIIPKDT